MKEIFKDIKGYEGIYQISNLGRVKSLERKKWNRWSFYQKKEKILKGRNQKGWLKVRLYKDGIGRNYLIHRLVLFAFVGESDLDINHKNFNRSDNRLNNLEYCTKKENVYHSIKNKRHKVFGHDYLINYDL